MILHLEFYETEIHKNVWQILSLKILLHGWNIANTA